MGLVKMSVNLPEEVVEELRTIADRRRITLTQTIRDAIEMEKFITDETKDNNSHFLIEKEDGTVSRVVFGGLGR